MAVVAKGSKTLQIQNHEEKNTLTHGFINGRGLYEIRLLFWIPLQSPEAGVLKKLSLSGLAKLSRLRYS
jgi:hypothetical protein